MDTTIFEDLGLTNSEIKIYISLLELGSTKAGGVIQKTGLQNSVAHLSLHKLVEKGFVSFVKKGNVKFYQAADPKNIIDFIEEKKTKFNEILPELLKKQKPHEPQEAEVYQGFKGFKTMLYELIKDGKKGDEYLVFAFHTSNPDDYSQIYNYYNEFDAERKRRGFVTKLLCPEYLREKVIRKDMKTVTFVNYTIPLNISIFQNKVILTPYEEEKVCFLIHSKQLADQFRKLFYSIWNKENGLIGKTN
ncbi:MAG: helix-turn-helix domain-containing protein [archaeon]